jgi:hypothetical protein
LTVNGNTTTVNTEILTVEDPLILLASTQTGTPTVDIGIIGDRGSSSNVAMVWREANTEFVTAYTSTGESNTVITLTSYAPFHAGNITADGNLSVTGNVAISGNIANINVTGNVTGGNLATSGTVSATGNIRGGNVNTAGLVTATGNVTGGNLLTGGLLSVAANITGGNVLTGGLISATSTITSAANVIGGNLTTGGQVSATANITGGNILTGGLISAAGNITSATNINTPNVVGATGLTISTGSGDLVLNSSGNINASSNYINNLADPAQSQDAATKQYVDDAVSSGITIHEPVRLESPTALNGTYAQGGTTATVTATVAGNTVVFGSAISPQVNDQYWFTSSFQGIVANTPYFVVSAPNTSAAVLSTTYSGAPVSDITSATGLTQAVRINSGQGATLTNAGANAVLVIDGVTVATADRILVYEEANAAHNGVYVVSEAGNATTAWQLTRSQDMDTYIPDDINGVDAGDYFYVQDGDTGAGESYVMTAPTGPTIVGYDNLIFTQFSASQVYSANTSAGLNLTGTVFSAKIDNNTTAFDGGGNIIVKAGANLTTPNIGAATGTSLSVTGNVTGSNVTATNAFFGNVDLTGNIVVNSLTANTFVSATGNVQGGNLITAGLVSATGNITTAGALNGATLSLSGNVTSPLNVTGNITSGNILTPGVVSATANITGGNVLTGGVVSATGAGTFGNITVGVDSINSANNRITVNSTSADTDIAFNADTVANVFYIDAGTGTASFGTSTQTTNAIVAFNATTSILAPVGNTAQRPATGVTGMLRFNTTNNAVEVYDNTEWTSVGVPVFTVIDDEQFNGDGSTVAFTLGSTQTTNSCIVSINGVVQIPTIAYSVSGTDPTCVLTFTEAPASGDLIDVRQITTTTTVTSIANSSGNAIVGVSPTTDDVIITGDLVPTGNLTQDLGSATNQWKDLYLSGNSIILGNTVIKNTSGNTIGFFGPNGTTPATIDASSVNTATIANGTSSMAVIASGGNIRANIGGATVQTISAGLVAITGNLTVSTGNVSCGNIVNTNANGVGNIGSSGTRFNQVFALASSAQYADLAEKYTADAEYVPGTVVVFGGTAEVTIDAQDADRRVAGVVSTNPAYIMNDTLESTHVTTVALTGRVPCLVTGPVRKGDLMVAAGLGRARAEADPHVGTVIGKALENFAGGVGTIEVVVGRF